MERFLRLVRLWFTFTGPVGRLEYALSGALLVPLKIGIDATLYSAATGQSWPLTSYLQPTFNLRFGHFPAHEAWVVWALALVTLPFLWIGVSMTVRRCLDAGLVPGWSLLFFVPVVNYVLMVLLCFLPPRIASYAIVDPLTGRAVPVMSPSSVWVSAVASGAALGLLMMIVSVVLLERYGAALFVGAPFVVGAASAFVLNRRSPHGMGATIGAGQLALGVSAMAILMFALEGALCLAMAYPLAAPLALLGSWLGRSVALCRPPAPAPGGALCIVLPLLLAADVLGDRPPLREVMTTVEIDAPRQRVWTHVTAFPDLDPPREWVFRLGIAYPVGAHIERDPSGGTRYCEFSTGAFVEPITLWEPPQRLAFDVVAQPPPMREISPYPHVFAPHLLDGMVTKRGEFRLVELPGDRTRLEGRTWYALGLWPQAYWSKWSDFIVHRIHRRVLEHVAGLSVTELRTECPDE